MITKKSEVQPKDQKELDGIFKSRLNKERIEREHWAAYPEYEEEIHGNIYLQCRVCGDLITITIGSSLPQHCYNCGVESEHSYEMFVYRFTRYVPYKNPELLDIENKGDEEAK